MANKNVNKLLTAFDKCLAHHIFCNIVFAFLSLRLRDFLYNVFRWQGKMGKIKEMKNKQNVT